MRLTSLAAALVASLPALAFAQDARPPMTPPPPPVAAPTPPPAPLEDGVDLAQMEDPNIDRSFLLPTAQTQPKGTLSFNDYELLIMGLTYGVTNDLQVSAQGLVPIVSDMPVVVMGAAKARLVNAGPLRLAVQGGFTYLHEQELDENGDSDSILIGHVGLLASACLTDDCHSMLSASAQFAQVVSGEADDNNETVVIYSASALVRVSPRVKLMLEAASAGLLSDEEDENLDGFLLNYGLRFFSGPIAADLGFMKPIAADADELVVGIPFVNFTYRH